MVRIRNDQSKKKKGYTDNQNVIASWIMSGRKFDNTHIMIREDDVLRKYVLNPLAQATSHWYYIVKDGDKSRFVKDLDNGGHVLVVGNGGSAGYTQVYHSSFGITITNTERAGKKPNGKGHRRVIEQA